EIDTNEDAMPDPTRVTRDTADKPAKKSYEPPRILSRERLEAIAALCNLGKQPSSNCPPEGPFFS
ncbi:MAG: hypothetical protein KDI73_15420, partial [Candidatus Competibacteraceae bacterium]|nr:hypothetical protein [Candidatus Competibacteraceae bacterium]